MRQSTQTSGADFGAATVVSTTVAVIRRLLAFLLPYRKRIGAGFLLLLVDVALELAPGFVWMHIVDQVIIKRDLSTLPSAVGALVGIALAETVVSRSRRLMIEASAQGFVFDLRQALFAKLARLPLGYFNESRTGDLMSRVSSDVDAVQEVVVNGTDNLLANLLRLVGVLVIFCSLNLWLGLATFSPILAVGFLLLKFNRRVKPLYKAAREQVGALSARLGDVLGGIRVVKAFAHEKREKEGFRALSDLLLQTNLKATRARANSFPWVGFVVSFTNTIMLAFGAVLIVRGEFTLGGLVAMRTYGRFFYGPIDYLAQTNDMLQRAIAAGTRIFEVIDAPETIQDKPAARDLPPVRGRIDFEEVTFKYDLKAAPPITATEALANPAPAREESGSGEDGWDAGPETNLPTLHHVSFRLEPGQKVALVGESGAGKSTIFALLQRFWDPTEGSVRIDGHDLRDVTQASLRRQIVAVQQDTFLFADTVAENIRYGRPEATDEEVVEAARAANAHSFISNLPEGYASLVGERGVKLSGGQRQRIAVARAFLAGGAIVLLDEATSAVEPESERLIYESLDRLLAGRTAVVATHRLSTIRDADLILVLQRGQLAEKGTHSELMALDGIYARMIADTERV